MDFTRTVQWMIRDNEPPSRVKKGQLPSTPLTGDPENMIHNCILFNALCETDAKKEVCKTQGSRPREKQ